MPGAVTLGHVHLKVSDVARATDFYRDTLGFDEQASMPSASFLAAGGYHHHIGLNSWQSRGAEPPSGQAPGLREVVFELSGTEALGWLQQRPAPARTQRSVPETRRVARSGSLRARRGRDACRRARAPRVPFHRLFQAMWSDHSRCGYGSRWRRALYDSWPVSGPPLRCPAWSPSAPVGR